MMVANSWDRPELRATSVNGSVQWVLQGERRLTWHGGWTSVATASAGASIWNGPFCLYFFGHQLSTLVGAKGKNLRLTGE